ncbi:hypothetical protein [Methanosarcina mazei]|uniref:hypothetical protein n=1 Tax=Methanosarcina mazei TaxID=2209 RepID=UPI00064FF2B9|nr:hypothetical protein [Methanosarcina mazei]
MGIISGRKLKQLASENKRAVYTQSAKDAVRAIIKKFGSIADNTKYYHRGNGVWSIYTISEDRKKTGKIATNPKHWKSEPWRWDLKKIDTKEGLTLKRNEVKVKKPKRSKLSKSKQINIFSRF